MDTSSSLPSISIAELMREHHSLILFDVRREEHFAEAVDTIPGARRGRPDQVAFWSASLPRADQIVVACVHGHEVSQGVCTSLLQQGYKARYLVGGIEGWRAIGGAMQMKP